MIKHCKPFDAKPMRYLFCQKADIFDLDRESFIWYASSQTSSAESNRISNIITKSQHHVCKNLIMIHFSNDFIPVKITKLGMYNV